jgi:hypothetical protein
MELYEIDRLIGKEFFEVQELTVEEAVEKFANQNLRTFTHDGCIVDRYTKLKFDTREYKKRFFGGYYTPIWKEWLIENSTVETTYPPYSSNMNEAWKVVEKIKEKRFSIRNRFVSELQKEVAPEETKNRGNLVDAGWMIFFLTPKAICLAALKALEIDVEV